MNLSGRLASRISTVEALAPRSGLSEDDWIILQER